MPDDLLVHVVDDDAAVRDSLHFLLTSAGLSVRVYDRAQPLLDVLDDAPAGCVLADLRMPGMDGLELLSSIKARGTAIPVVMMTGDGDIPLAVQAMKLGATDFIQKPLDDHALLDTIRAACGRSGTGKSPDPACADFLRRLDLLSHRERQVFDRMVAGQANKITARELEISPRTVEIYRAHVMAKLRANSITELVRLAVRAGVA